MNRYLAGVLWALLLAGLLALAIAVTTRRHATHLEDALVQFILFGVGLAASFYLGTRSVKKAASEVIRPSASGALRRLVSLGRGVKTIQRVVQANAREAGSVEAVPSDRVVANLETVHLLLEGQVEVVEAAIEDWRQFTPELVNELQEEGQHRG